MTCVGEEGHYSCRGELINVSVVRSVPRSARESRAWPHYCALLGVQKPSGVLSRWQSLRDAQQERASEESASYYKDLPLECYSGSHASFISKLSLLPGRRTRVKGCRAAPKQLLWSRLPGAAALRPPANDFPRAGGNQGEAETAPSNQLPHRPSPLLCTQQAGD